MFKGLYHILGGTLSALDDRGPAQLNIDSLIARAARDEVAEIILATNATIEGQTTAHYLMGRLEGVMYKFHAWRRGSRWAGSLIIWMMARLAMR